MGFTVPDEAREVVVGRRVGPGVLALFREDAMALVVIFGPGHVGWVGLTALMVLGVIPTAVGGISILVCMLVSFLVYLWGYRWLEERGRRERISALALAGMPLLASRVMALYSLPAGEPGAAEVFALYRQAQQSLEIERDPRSAREKIERGVYLADGILAGSPDESSQWSERKER